LHAGGHCSAEVRIRLLLLCCRLPPILSTRTALCGGTADCSGGCPFSGVVASDRGARGTGCRASCPPTCPGWWRSGSRGTRGYTGLLRGPGLAGSLVLGLHLLRLPFCRIEDWLLGNRDSGSHDKKGQCPQCRAFHCGVLSMTPTGCQIMPPLKTVLPKFAALALPVVCGTDFLEAWTAAILLIRMQTG